MCIHVFVEECWYVIYTRVGLQIHFGSFHAREKRRETQVYMLIRPRGLKFKQLRSESLLGIELDALHLSSYRVGGGGLLRFGVRGEREQQGRKKEEAQLHGLYAYMHVRMCALIFAATKEEKSVLKADIAGPEYLDMHMFS